MSQTIDHTHHSSTYHRFANVPTADPSLFPFMSIQLYRDLSGVSKLERLDYPTACSLPSNNGDIQHVLRLPASNVPGLCFALVDRAHSRAQGSMFCWTPSLHPAVLRKYMAKGAWGSEGNFSTSGQSYAVEPKRWECSCTMTHAASSTSVRSNG